jgi:hypothetical protein
MRTILFRDCSLTLGASTHVIRDILVESVIVSFRIGLQRPVSHHSVHPRHVQVRRAYV